MQHLIWVFEDTKCICMWWLEEGYLEKEVEIRYKKLEMWKCTIYIQKIAGGLDRQSALFLVENKYMKR